jgi:hypothetical protein
MFEPPQQKQPVNKTPIWIGLAIAVLAAGAIFVFMTGKKDAASNADTSASASAAPTGKADAIHDLKIQRAVMDKDSSGTTAVWAISIENKSPSYAYSNIEYETSYMAADGKVITTNTGRLPLSISPHDVKNTQLRDVTYPSGTARYRIRVLAAASEVE